MTSVDWPGRDEFRRELLELVFGYAPGTATQADISSMVEKLMAAVDATRQCLVDDMEWREKDRVATLKRQKDLLRSRAEEEGRLKGELEVVDFLKGRDADSIKDLVAAIEGGEHRK